MDEKHILDAVKKIRSNENERKEKRTFDQTLDLIVNLKEFDVRRQAFTTFASLPKKFKDKKVIAFFEKESSLVDSIQKENFVQYKDKKDIKKLIRTYDTFIASAKLMPAVATSFGRVLGPAGKMPSPQLGIVPQEEDATVKAMLEKVNTTVKIAVKEPSIKVIVLKFSLSDEDLMQNIVAAYSRIVESLPKGKDNVRNVKIKFTMGAPVQIAL